MPVEMALMNFNDETASYLFTQMDNEWWVGLNLFQFNGACHHFQDPESVPLPT